MICGPSVHPPSAASNIANPSEPVHRNPGAVQGEVEEEDLGGVVPGILRGGGHGFLSREGQGGITCLWPCVQPLAA